MDFHLKGKKLKWAFDIVHKNQFQADNTDKFEIQNNKA